MTSRNDLERAKRGLGHAKPAFELNSGPLDPRSREVPPPPSVDGFSHWNGVQIVFRRCSEAWPDALSGDTPVRGLVIGATTARVLNFAQCAP
jgi:hypothetical protein